MSGYGKRSSLGTAVTWLLAGLVAILALKVAWVLAGAAIGLLFFGIFTLGPIVLVGWLVLKALRHFARDTDEVVI
jgi:hypothetical protein